MADRHDMTIGIGLKADLEGGVQTEKQLEKIRQKARDFGKDANDAGNQAGASFERLQKTVGTLNAALTGFGVAGMFTALIAGVQKITGSFGHAKKAAEEVAKEQAGSAESKASDALGAGCDRLKASIAASTAEQNRQLELIDAEVSARRRLDAAKLASEKERALASLDPSSPDYAEKVKAVETRFGAAEAAMRASNADEDVTRAKQRLVDQAVAKDQEAAAEEARQKAIRAQINAARREQSRASFEAVELNDNDKTGVLSALGTTMRQLFSGDWGRMAGAKTAEGDAVRKEAGKRAQEAERKAAQLQEQLRASEERQAELRKEAEQLRRKADVKGGEHEAARIERETEESRARRTNAEAARSLADRQEQIKADEELIGGADARRASIQARIDAENARLQAAADRSNKEDRDVYLAQRRLEQADAENRGKGWKRYVQGARKDLAAEVRREEEEASEARAEFKRTETSVGETVRKLLDEMRKFNADYNRATSRMNVRSDNGGASQ